jgi:copper chaperone NosL
MTISDPRFGGEVVTRTGRVETFDSLECMAAWVRKADSATIAGIYAIDLDRPGTFVTVTTAGFLRDLSIRGPMGHALAAFASPAAAEARRAELGGTVVTWHDILNGAPDAAGRVR